MSEALQGVLDGMLGRRGVHHAVLAVESGDRSLSWVGAGGDADSSGRSMTTETPYFIASVTKLYYAAIVVRLAERGEIDLDASMASCLPGELTERLHVLGGVDRTAEISVRNLATHTSGLPDYIEDKPKSGKRLVERILAEGDRGVTVAEVCEIARTGLTPHFRPQRLGGDGRVKARYSDTNFALLRAIIEAVTGSAWPDALRTELLEPLGLRHTWVPGSEPLEVPAEQEVALWAGQETIALPKFLAAVGDLYSTVPDQIGFIRALVSGTAFDDPDTARTMWSGWNTLAFDPTTPRLPGWPIEYGFGTMRFGLPRWLTPLRAMPPFEGHSGSTGCWLYYSPDLDVYTCGAVDQIEAGALPYRVLPKLMAILTEPRG